LPSCIESTLSTLTLKVLAVNFPVIRTSPSTTILRAQTRLTIIELIK
jgi:hypothetical protein